MLLPLFAERHLLDRLGYVSPTLRAPALIAARPATVILTRTISIGLAPAFMVSSFAVAQAAPW